VQRPYGVQWHEGMFLTPQHLQQNDRHRDAVLAQILRALSPHHHGVVAMELDQLALAQGACAIARIEAIMPDGTPVAVLSADDLPPARRFADAFTPQTARLGVHLALPLATTGAVTMAEGGTHAGRQVRWRVVAADLADESPGGQERPVPLACPNLRLLLDGESLDGHVALKIAEIVRDASGGFQAASDFAPPCLRLGASQALTDIVRRMAEILVQRSDELARLRRSRTKGLVEFTASELGNQLMLGAINAHLPDLLALLAERASHPREVHRCLAALCGQLLSFADEGHPRDLPPYRHDEPHTGLAELERRLRALLTTVVTTRHVPISVSMGPNRVAAGTIPEHVLENARFYMAVVSSAPAERVLRDLPMKGKVAAGGRIQVLMTQAVAGIGLDYLPTPPPEIPVQPGSIHFQLRTSGPEWDAAMRSRTIAVYLPPEFGDARVEFLAVKD
jgi:type VI secretion system protein ImpJ